MRRTNPWSIGNERLCRLVWVFVFWHTADCSKWSKWPSLSSNRHDRHLHVPSSVSSIHRRVDLNVRKTESSFLDCNCESYRYVHRQRLRCHGKYCSSVRFVWRWSCNPCRTDLLVCVFSPWWSTRTDDRTSKAIRNTYSHVSSELTPPIITARTTTSASHGSTGFYWICSCEISFAVRVAFFPFLLTIPRWFEHLFSVNNQWLERIDIAREREGEGTCCCSMISRGDFSAN